MTQFRWHLFWAGSGALILLSAMLSYLIAGDEAGFLGHMFVHVINLGIAAPLIGFGLRSIWPTPQAGRTGLACASLNAPVLIAILELIVVWTWHWPAFHEAARMVPIVFVGEQLSILLIGILLWTPALAALEKVDTPALGSATLAFLITSMHMTLLGAVVLFAPRALYFSQVSGYENFCGQGPVADQQAGATVMLAALGVIYLIAGLRFLEPILNDVDRKGDAIPD